MGRATAGPAKKPSQSANAIPIWPMLWNLIRWFMIPPCHIILSRTRYADAAFPFPKQFTRQFASHIAERGGVDAVERGGSGQYPAWRFSCRVRRGDHCPHRPVRLRQIVAPDGGGGVGAAQRRAPGGGRHPHTHGWRGRRPPASA